MRITIALFVLVTLACLGCLASGNPPLKGPPPLQAGENTEANEATAASSPPSRSPSIAAERRVWAYVDGVRKAMDMDDARSRGLTLVDLSDDWVPYIFWSRTPGKDDYKENGYLDDYVDLANDRIDVDGVALSSWERNYLEVYGIPPSLSVLRRRFLADEKEACFKDLDTELFSEYFGPIRIVDAQGSEKEEKLYHGARAAFRKALHQARVKTLEELLKLPAYETVAKTYQKYHWRHRAILELQKRMVCEKMFGKKSPKLKPGVMDWALQEAVKIFERKHNIYGWGMVFQATAEALGRTPLQNNYESLKRALTERVVSAAGLLEDGTVTKATYRTSSGQRQKVPNIVEEFSRALLQQMGLTTPERALAFMKEHEEKDLGRLFVAVKLPSVPEYYGPQMDFSAVIDRGDVWYDFPFDEKGRRKNQPRSRMPHLTLYVRYGGQEIPLVRWQTTIGSWQPEMRNDQEYYKYKISDVGPRIWKNIVAGPVWVPPPNTPSRDMVKIRPVRSTVEPIVAHQAFGPGYASAYGLVAAFHVTKDGHDNQVRTHGSVNYMSILSSFSHGCHRLFNYRAVRLFSFILAHHEFERKGQTKLGYGNQFEHKGEEFHVDLSTRGYYYQLKPPIPVNVLEGTIRGEAQEPTTEYVKKPTVVYQEDLNSLQHKAPSGAPRVQTKKKPKLMDRPQNL